MSTLLPISVLISGSGTNLQAILDAARSGSLPVRIVSVISDQPDAYGLTRAAKAGVPGSVLEANEGINRQEYDQALGAVLGESSPGLVVLAGFMRILGAGLVRDWEGRMLNVHPSLLPAYRGLHTHRRVLAAGEPHHGTSVHFVTEELDGGPLIAQAKLDIGPEDTEQTLNARVQALEHCMYPAVIRWFAQDRLRMIDGRVELDGAPLEEPVIRGEEAWLRSSVE